ncbi:MAG: N-acetylmuramoyl-L-alanine amidase [Candidatus Gracilibacteria bacterium]|nr:N-acetylmuramoyl-L-alanine amidase [Candidatus Gracilibacteria bacterium]
MRKTAILTSFFFLSYIFAPIGNMFDFKRTYTFESETDSKILELNAIYAQESSNVDLPLKISSYSVKLNSSFLKPKDTFVFKIKKTDDLLAKDISISLNSNEKKISIQIDNDGDGRILKDEYFYTEPVFLNSKNSLDYEIESKKDISGTDISLIGIDTKSYSENIEFNSDYINANASDSNIVTRSEWGADESLRYEDNPFWVSYFQKQSQNTTPKTPYQIKAEQRIIDINNYLSVNFPEQNSPVDMIRQESGHELVWPIEKTKRVEKIIIHHTAGEYKDEQDDSSIVRGIYYYHAITRGWGDIGYNYLIGRDGKIYEGRAGGDYVVAAHALWNNKSTVGVSVIGNFQVNQLPYSQRTGIDSSIEYLEKKYGIDINKTSMGHKECSESDTTCLLKDFTVFNLSGHRDVGYTSCPGDNLYPILDSMRANEKLYSSQSLTYIDNPNINLANVSAPNQQAVTTSNLVKGPTIKVRLSYSGNTVDIKALTGEKMKITLGTKSGYIIGPLKFETKGSNMMRLYFNGKRYAFDRLTLDAKILEIPSWSRIPAWDTKKIYNDNKFRGSITIYNENGKLMLVNELPVEDYLRGLGEISNNDNPEKVKTILVAARSYAMWYTDPANRKFPGKYYDGSDNPNEFQKYLGYEYEKRSPNIGKYVDETNNIVIKYDGKLIKPWYFNQSAGNTKSYKQYCEDRKKSGSYPLTMVCEDIAYFQSVVDPAGDPGGGLKGHGVGISGAGSTYLATKNGFTYDQIIRYFLKGVTVEKAGSGNLTLNN